MKKIHKIFLIGFLALALVVGVGASYAGATLTLDALTITSSGALTLSGAAGSAITVGNAAQTGTISVGDSTGAMTMNLASGNSIKTINLGTGTGIKTIHIGDNATPVNVITIGGAASSLALADADWSITSPGAATFVTVNGNTITTGTGTLTLATGKTLTASNTLTFAGTDGTTMTFPSTSATIARTDAANTFTGVQTMTSPIFVTPALGTPASGVLTNVTGLPTAGLVDAAVTRVKMSTAAASSDVHATSATIATTGNTDAYIIVPQTGVLTGVDFSDVDALAASDTNYITWTITNLGQAGAGATVMLAATDANTTKATGGTALAANTKRSLTVTGTGGDLVVTIGDRLRIRAAATGTLANTVTFPVYMIRFGGTN